MHTRGLPMRPSIFSTSILALIPLVLTSAITAQAPIPIELSVNNSRRVIQGFHAVTTNPYPATVTVPAEYSTPAGVPAGLRTYNYTPRLRLQAGQQNDFLTVSGMSMAIFTGAAVTSFPAPNHYQFRSGVAPAAASTNPQIMQHASTGADLFSIADAPIVINQWAIVEHTVTVMTPVPLPQTELLLFAEYRGGEYREDPNGGQVVGADWQGGDGPAGIGIRTYQGHTRGQIPRSVTPFSSYFRPKIGLIVEEPLLTATGFHANGYFGSPTPPLAREDYRGLAACYADWSTNPQGTLFFDFRAGDVYGSGASGVVFLNFSSTPAPFRFSLPPFGFLMLNPNDPLLAALSGVQFTLIAGGIYDQGPINPIPVPSLGIASRGFELKAQGLVIDNGLTRPRLTNASSIRIY